MSEFQGAVACVAACAAILFVSQAVAAGSAPRVPHAGEPAIASASASVTDERARILLSELDRERLSLAQATQQRAQRTAAGDVAGARAARESQTRITENIAALQRELSRPAVPVHVKAADAASTRGARTVQSSSPATPPTANLWWDVYAHRALSVAKPASTNAAPQGVGDLPTGALQSRLP